MATIGNVDASCDRDADQLRAIFPEEVWLLIMNNMKSDELINFCNSSPYFRYLFLSKRVQFLFPEVMNIMQTHGYLIPKRVKRNAGVPVEAAPNEDEGNVNPIVSVVERGPRKILKLRQVCKSWKNTIDQWYQTRLLHNHPCDVRYGKFFEQKFLPHVQYEDNDDRTTIATFLTFFQGSHGNQNEKLGDNPFLSRGCNFVHQPFRDETHQEFARNISLLLTKYGHHLYKCSFEFNHYFDARPDYIKLREWLGLLPNLKSLKIIAWNGMSVRKNEVDRMAAEVKTNPLPKMENLEHLAFGQVAFSLFAHLIQVNNHVTHLDLIQCRNDGKYNIFAEPLLNLKHLKVDIYSNGELERLRDARFSPNFETLEMTFYYIKVSPKKLFTLLWNKWGETLTSVTLDVFFENNYRSEKKAKIAFREKCVKLQQLYMPQVKDLKVTVTYPEQYSEQEYFES